MKKGHARTVRVGFEVGSGEEVCAPISHMTIVGMTQLSGKTTTLEAMIKRAALPAIVFKTKRGERAFEDCEETQPYFRERADWVFVSSLIDATMREKNRLIRSWLMKVCQNTKTLEDVLNNTIKAKAKSRGFSESIYTEIEGYLNLVVPQLRYAHFASGINLNPGVNMMDLTSYSSEVQGLIMRSAIEWVHEKENGVITVIPEAWEFLGENRNSPVKHAVEMLIRKGAGLRNFVWADSQDLAGVWKLMVRASGLLMIGVQREANEIDRTLKNIPSGMGKPTKSEVAHQKLGQFYACWADNVKHTYVQPAWMEERDARRIAAGTITIDTIGMPVRVPKKVEDQVNKETAERLQRENDELRDKVSKYEAMLNPAPQKVSSHQLDPVEAMIPLPSGKTIPVDMHGASDFTQFMHKFIEMLQMKKPHILTIVGTVPEIEVDLTPEKIEVDKNSLFGRVARLTLEGWFENAKTNGATVKELGRTGPSVNSGNLARELAKMVKLGFLTDEPDGFREVKGMKKNIKAK